MGLLSHAGFSEMVWEAPDTLGLIQAVLASTAMEYIIIVTCDAIHVSQALHKVPLGSVTLKPCSLINLGEGFTLIL